VGCRNHSNKADQRRREPSGLQKPSQLDKFRTDAGRIQHCSFTGPVLVDPLEPAFAQIGDVLVGAETGPLNAVAMVLEPVREKVPYSLVIG
jgi:hypothetical protein